eukprot:2469556-Pleurochrysis_carterae.AAC.1
MATATATATVRSRTARRRRSRTARRRREAAIGLGGDVARRPSGGVPCAARRRCSCSAGSWRRGCCASGRGGWMSGRRCCRWSRAQCSAARRANC